MPVEFDLVKLSFFNGRPILICKEKVAFSNEKERPAPFATSYMVGREDKRTNNRTMLPALKNNAAAGYQGPVKIEVLTDAGLRNTGKRICVDGA